MIRCIIFLLVISLLARCDDTLHDGPCAHPKPDDISKLTKFNGNWWVVQSNYEELKQNPVSCAKFFLANANNDFEGKIVYKDSNLKEYSSKLKFVMLKDQPGQWTNYLIDESNGKYEPDGWVYTLVKVAGKDKELSVLVYACKKVEDKHQSFYRIDSKKNRLDNKTRDILLEAYKASGDRIPLINIANDNCN